MREAGILELRLGVGKAAASCLLRAENLWPEPDQRQNKCGCFFHWFILGDGNYFNVFYIIFIYTLYITYIFTVQVFTVVF